jgi:hypothetical protein
MQLPTPVKAFIFAAAVAAAGVWLVARPRTAVAPSAVPTEPPAPSPEQLAPSAAAPAVTSAAAAKLRELGALSETFRNTTFLIAIRDEGFVCHDLIDVYGGVNNSRTWTATCRDMLAYTVHVTDDGALAVEPMLHQLDSVTPNRPRQAPVDPAQRGPLEPR